MSNRLFRSDTRRRCAIAGALLSLLVCVSISDAQVSQNDHVFLAKHFSKEEALYKARAYVMQTVLGVNPDVTRFMIDPLAATHSGEVTSLVYECEAKRKRGLVLGFFGTYRNEAGLSSPAHAFKNLPEVNAYELLAKLEHTIKNFSGYLAKDVDNNNVFFSYEDMTFLVYREQLTGKSLVRVFWNSFDAEWESKAIKRTKKRLDGKLRD